jgi:hypothetical protein
MEVVVWRHKMDSVEDQSYIYREKLLVEASISYTLLLEKRIPSVNTIYEATFITSLGLRC